MKASGLLCLAFACIALAQGPGGSGDGIWLRNAGYGEAQTFDSCLGHQPQSGQYHYHVAPTCLRAQLNDNITVVQSRRNGAIYMEKPAPWTHSPILGWAYDGYPIYGPYGYSNPNDVTSAVKRLKSSFRLRNITQRISLPDWATAFHTNVSQQLSAAQYGPNVSTLYPLGRYVEDYEYVDGLGDLDVYNGRTTVTPEFPGGTYAYFVALDSDGAPAFPYILGMQYRGTAAGGNSPTIPPGTQDYFVSGTSGGLPPFLVPLLNSWAVKNSQQFAQVVSALDPSAGPSNTWGSVTTPALADVQRIRLSSTTVYINANGLASYAMGPWFDVFQPGGVFGNLPANANYQVQLPRTPAVPATKTATGLGPVGLWANGVAVFNILDGASYSTSRAADIGGGMVAVGAVLVSAASFDRAPVAAGSLIAAFPILGGVVGTTTAAADSAIWPTSLGGTTVSVRDSAGVSRSATISYVSPAQVNFHLPDTLAAGYGSVTISAGGTSLTSNINVVAAYPNLFGGGYFLRIRNGQVTVEDATLPVDLGPDTDQVYLILFGSGLGSATSASATIGGATATVAFAGAQGTYSGLDQYNVLVPRSLIGRGKVDVLVKAGGKTSNAVNITVR